MFKFFRNIFSLLRYLFIIVTFPAYFFYLFNLKCIVASFNMYVRAVFSDYIIKRKDRYYAGLSFVLLAFYLLIYLKFFDFIFRYIDFGAYQVYADYIYSIYFYIRYWVVKVSFFTIPFVILDEFLFKKLLNIGQGKAPGKVARYRLREKAIKEDKIFAGTSRDNKSKPLFITDEMRSLHVECVGTTGTGKSASFIFPWAYQDIKRGRGVIIIDAKGDVRFFEKLYTFHKRFNDNKQKIKFVNLGDPSFSNTYNPLFRGNAIELKDRIMGAFIWSEEFYKTRAESTLLTLLQAVENVGKTITFHDLYILLTEEMAVEELRNMVDDDFIKKQLQTKIIDDFKNIKKECAGLINNIDLLAHGGISDIVNTYNPDIDLLEVYKNNEIVYFTLPSNLIGETARAFGKMLLMDLKSTGGYVERKEAERRFFPVFIDEFAEFATEEFVGWLNKARSSGFAIHLAHQSLGDLEQVDEAFVKQVIDNTNMKIIFRVNDSETAENFAKQLGTFTTFKETERVDKSLLTQSEGFYGSIREVEEFLISPNVIKRELKRGQAIIFGKHPEMFYNIINTDYIDDPSDYEKIVLEKKDIFVNSNGLYIDRVIFGDKSINESSYIPAVSEDVNMVVNDNVDTNVNENFNEEVIDIAKVDDDSDTEEVINLLDM